MLTCKTIQHSKYYDLDMHYIPELYLILESSLLKLLIIFGKI